MIFEDILNVPTLIKGAYFISSETEQKLLNFKIFDPENSILFQRKNSEQAIFYLNATKLGSYKFVF